VIGQRANAPAWDESVSPTPKSPPPVRPQPPKPAIVQPDNSGSKDFYKCPNTSCNYLNLPKAKTCVACGAELAAPGKVLPRKGPVNEKQQNEQMDATRREELDPDDYKAGKGNQAVPPPLPSPKRQAPSPNINATVNPWSKRKEASFTLRLLAREGETAKADLEFEGSTELNRANLEPSNTTITGKTQAVIEYQDGTWYITNKSALQTTFIRVDEPVQLKKGDVILMGDRTFEFNPE
jgi:hypothetical protein